MTRDGRPCDAPRFAAERLHVVVPVHNGRSYLPALLESLQRQSRRPDRIHLVDNGSTADEVLRPADLPAEVDLHTIGEPLGFGAASNVGLTAAFAAGADYILLLNQDLTVEPEACARVLVLGAANDTFGLIGLSQLSYDGTALDAPFRNVLPAPAIDDAFLSGMKALYECEFVPAAAVLMPRRTLERVGLFDPLFFMYQEDKDYCRRVRRAGLKVAIATQARVRHDCGQHRAEKSSAWRANWYRSRAIYHLKWSPRSVPAAFLTLTKYMLPKWNLSESSAWLRAGLNCLRLFPTLRRRRGTDDGLQLPAAPAASSEADHETPPRRTAPPVTSPAN